MSRLSGITRLVRRICLLREQGDTVSAVRLEENDLATAVRDLRLAEGLEAVTEAGLREMFAAEERRVADAVVLAELLIPQLAGSFSTGATAGQRPGSNPSVGRTEPLPATRMVEPGTASPAIPDLLDAMLAADSAARRQRGNRLTT